MENTIRKYEKEIWKIQKGFVKVQNALMPMLQPQEGEFYNSCENYLSGKQLQNISDLSTCVHILRPNMSVSVPNF